MKIPCYCNVCIGYFDSGFAINRYASAEFKNVQSACPTCGTLSALVEGIYQFIDDVLVVTSNPEFNDDALEDLRRVATSVGRGTITGKQAGNQLEQSRPGLFARLLKWFNSPVGAAYVGIVATVAIYVHQAHSARSNQPPDIIAERAIDDICHDKYTTPAAPLISDDRVEKGHAKTSRSKTPYKNRHEMRRLRKLKKSKK